MRIKVFALALILSLFSSLSLVTPVQAVGMTPLQGIVGTTVTISDLLVGASYIVRWDGTSYKVGTVPVSADVTFTVPDASGGDHDVEVETSPPGTPVFTDSFTVLPSIDIDPNVGMVGASVTVTGKGFAAAEGSIVITYGGTNVKTGITADDDGSWSATFVVPSSTTGSHERHWLCRCRNGYQSYLCRYYSKDGNGGQKRWVVEYDLCRARVH
jgi:hypothetical protein